GREPLLRLPPQRSGYAGQDRSGRPGADGRRPRLGRLCPGGDAADAAPSGASRRPRGRRTAMTIVLRSYVQGRWVEGEGALATLVNPATEEPLARTGTSGIDLGAALEHARSGAGPLREMSFAQRGEMLRAWSKALHAQRDDLIALAVANGG